MTLRHIGISIAAAIYCSPLCAEEVNPVLENWKFGLSVVGYLGAATAFGIGLRQYRRTDYWTRCQFLAKEMKEFFADRKVEVALTMIDWELRRIKLLEASANTLRPKESDSGVRRVDRALQCSALRPHTMMRWASSSTLDHLPPDQSDNASMALERSAERKDDINKLGGTFFTPDEAAIRDCYDHLLDGFERFGNYWSGRLLSVDDLRPYVEYWVKTIADERCNAEDAMWTVCLFVYIDFYAFVGVQALFKAFGYDISPAGALAQRFAGICSDALRARALLQELQKSKETTPDGAQENTDSMTDAAI